MSDEAEHYWAGTLDPRATVSGDEEIDMTAFELRKYTRRKMEIVRQNRPQDISIAICLHTETEAMEFGSAILHHQYCEDLKMMLLFPIRPAWYALNLVSCKVQNKLRHQPSPWIKVDDFKWIYANILHFLKNSTTLVSVTLSFERLSYYGPELLHPFSQATSQNANIKVVNILRACGTSRIIRRIRQGPSVSELNLVDVYTYDAAYWWDNSPILNYLGQRHCYPPTFRSRDMHVSFGRKTRSIRKVLARLVEYNCLRCFHRFLGMFTPFERSMIKRFKSHVIRFAVRLHQCVPGVFLWTEYDTVFYVLLTHKLACKDDPTFEKRIRLAMTGYEIKGDTSKPGWHEALDDSNTPQDTMRRSVSVSDSGKEAIESEFSVPEEESQV